jgi:tol-pal system protein YbgF
VKQRQLIGLLALPVLACAPSKRIELSVESLERNQVALKMQQAETQRKIEDLSNSLMVLQDRLETLKVASDRQPSPPPVAVSKSKPKRKASTKTRASGEETEEKSALGFGQAGGSHLPAIQLTNRDLDSLDPKSRGKEPIKREEERAASGPSDNPDAARAYNEAFKKFEEGSYPDAIRMLEEFVAKYPAHVYSDNAVYWIGESHFRTRDFAKAAEQFERVGRDFPTGNKVPDALLRAASCYLRLNKPAEAQRTFDRIIATYPQSVAAQKARASLQEISGMGSEQGRM